MFKSYKQFLRRSALISVVLTGMDIGFLSVFWIAAMGAGAFLDLGAGITLTIFVVAIALVFILPLAALIQFAASFLKFETKKLAWIAIISSHLLAILIVLILIVLLGYYSNLIPMIYYFCLK